MQGLNTRQQQPNGCIICEIAILRRNIADYARNQRRAQLPECLGDFFTGACKNGAETRRSIAAPCYLVACLFFNLSGVIALQTNQTNKN